MLEELIKFEELGLLLVEYFHSIEKKKESDGKSSSASK
jgi:hypothetical protein